MKNFELEKTILHKTLSEQMGLTDLEISNRKQTLKFTPEHEKILFSCYTFIEQEKCALVEEFYQEQTQIKEIELLIGDADTLIRLQGAMIQYVQSLFGGFYLADYVTSRLRIGLVHKRIGVSPKLYLCGMQTLNEILSSALKDHYEANDDIEKFDQTKEALDRLLTFDIGLVFDTYIRSLTTEIEIGKENIEKHAKELESIVQQRTRDLEEQARHDPLTGLNNQRTFYQELNKALSAAKRYNNIVSLIYMDLDNFKKLNDNQGHLVGDKVLKDLSNAIKINLRDTDVAARYGGDEFCVVLPYTPLQDASIFCQRMNNKFTELNQHSDVSISCGIAQSGPTQHLDAAEFIKKADANMYKAKKEKGFTIVIDEENQEEQESDDGEITANENVKEIKLAKKSD